MESPDPVSDKFDPARLHNPIAQHDAGQKPLDSDQAQEGSSGRARFRVVITRYGSRPIDVDNGAGGCKPLLDAIRYEGLIPDDDPTTIDFHFRQYQVKKPYRNTHVLIERVQ